MDRAPRTQVTWTSVHLVISAILIHTLLPRERCPSSRGFCCPTPSTLHSHRSRWLLSGDRSCCQWCLDDQHRSLPGGLQSLGKRDEYTWAFKAELSHLVAMGHIQLFKWIKIKLKIKVTPDVFQMCNSHMWLVVAVLDNAAIGR